MQSMILKHKLYFTNKIFNKLFHIIIMIILLIMSYWCILSFGMIVNPHFMSLLLMFYKPFISELLGISIMLIGIMEPFKYFIFSKPKFDQWLPEYSKSTLSTTKMKYDAKSIYLDYNATMSEEQLHTFVANINLKSEKHNYYIKKINNNKNILELEIGPKLNIPDFYKIDILPNEKYNNIPIAIELQKNKYSKKSNYAYMGTNNKNNSIVLIGKHESQNNFELNIIGHNSRFSDKFNTFLISKDDKLNKNMKDIASVHSTANNTKEMHMLLQSSLRLMYRRYSKMKESNVKHINKLENNNVKYYEFNGKQYQFDELWPVICNGKVQIMQIQEIINGLKNNDDIRLIDSIN